MKWERGLKEIEKKVSWRVRKIKGVKRKKEKQEGEKLSEEERVNEMAAGNKERKRIVVEVPVIGDVEVDEDELNAARMPPKFVTYGKVKKRNVKLEKMISDTKMRWVMMDRDFDKNGNDVTEEDPC